ncbi:hypothetical protein HRI_004178300 [Hibiscus trionum]|uniref:Zinc knuckle CX2CX4HX4C domain-containing protein n=1 Tax=Hibiscus trionum TaxID=183268 RepID=A0A9W7IYL0_HIBTR|nr:hypothetical protein HRI_004178300 [Hibiscus trionum]
MDADRIEAGGPWNFNSHLLILHRLSPGEDPAVVPLDKVKFWVLIHNVSHGFVSERVASSIGNFLGSFLEYDSMAVSLGYKGIMRIRVVMDIRIPLKRKKKLKLQNGRDHYVRFEYERLTLFCFICGLLGHGESFCPLRTVKDPSAITFGWDISLRAAPRRRQQSESRWLQEESALTVHLSAISGDHNKENVIPGSTNVTQNHMGGILPAGHGYRSPSRMGGSSLGLLSQRPILGPVVCGPHPSIDTQMFLADEQCHLENVDSAKRP